ncbi:MAG TPA: hypothetical protein VMW52_07605, partial [Phycisphaerae bacterium]|nr:hypothetical protein [Phycisphaerae bacterium]
MAETFVQIWRQVKMYCHVAPPTLCRLWVKNRFEQVLDRRMWSFQWGTGCWNVKDPITGSATITQGSTQVDFPGGELPGDGTSIVGRQLVLNGQTPYYTITKNDSATQLFVDQAIVEPDAIDVDAEIVMAHFMSEKSDFEKLISIVDRLNGWQFRRNVSLEEMNNVDAERSSVGPPMWLVPYGFNDAYLAQLPAGVVDMYGQTVGSTPQPYMEAWPRATGARPYPYAYKRRTGDLLSDGDTLPGFMRGRVLLEGALSDLCSWPGTEVVRNPKYNPVSANVHEKHFEDGLLDMMFRDEQVTQRTLQWVASYT